MFRYMKRHPFRLLGTLGLNFLGFALITATTILDQMLIDAVTEGKDNAFTFYLPLSLVGTLVAVALVVVAGVCYARYVVRTTGEIRQDAFGGLMRKCVADFRQAPVGDYISALTNDIRSLKHHYFDMLHLLVVSAVGASTSIVLMFFYQPIVALCALLSCAAMFVVPMLFSKKLEKCQALQSKRSAELVSALSNLLAGFEVIASFGAKLYMDKIFRQAHEAFCDAEARTGSMNQMSSGLAQVFSALSNALTIIVACVMLAQGRMSFGALAVFSALQSTVSSGLSMALEAVPLMKSTRPIVERIQGMADSTPNPALAGRIVPTFREGIRTEKLRFSYPEGVEVLRGVDLALRKGEKYAIVGESGSGKTTLIRALCGDFGEYGGEIFYDGVELHQLDNAKLHALVSLIHQDVYLFDDSVYNNICLYETFPRDALTRALEHSGVNRFLGSLEGGLEYGVGENGNRLSGGQKQRVAIARALIRNTPILILDEGTSAIDSKTAEDIEGALLAMEELTLITITHHSTLLSRYDRVFEMAEGKLALANPAAQ